MQRQLSNRPAKWLFHVSGLITALVYGVLCWVSRTELPIDFSLFLTLCFSAFVLSLVAAWSIKQSQSLQQPAGRITLQQLLLWCVVFRVIAVIGEPIYEDDYYRYLWDGRQTVVTGNPYSEPPSAAFDQDHDAPWEEVLDNINHPEIRTIYGPVNQYMFGLAYLIKPGEIWVLQLLFAAADILVILLLARMATLAPLALYGFSPLVIKEYSFTAHPDVISLLALVAATLCWQRAQLYRAAMLLAVAVASKIFAFLLVPLLLRWHWRAWLVFAVLVLALHAPFIGLESLEALSAMAESWLFNAPVYYLFYESIDLVWVKGILFVGFATLCATYFFQANYWRQPRQVPRADWLYLAMLIALPVLNPWYYGFLLIYAVVYPSYWAWIGSLTVLLAYATGLQLTAAGLEPYQQPLWALVLEFLPIAIAALIPRLIKTVEARKQPTTNGLG